MTMRVHAWAGFGLVVGSMAGIWACSSSSGGEDTSTDYTKFECDTADIKCFSYSARLKDTCNTETNDTKCGEFARECFGCSAENQRCLPDGGPDLSVPTDKCPAECNRYTECRCPNGADSGPEVCKN
jgi:hypothetical protein